MPRILISTLAVLALVGAPAPSRAAEATLTLDEAVRLAGEQAPRVQAQAAAVDAARAEASRADALPDPMLMVGIDNLTVTGGNAFDPSVDDMTMKRIGVRQDVPAAAKREARRTLAERRLDEAQTRVDTERLRAQRAAAEAWIDAWAAGHQVHSLEALRDQARLAAKLARARAANGAGSMADALAVDASVLEIENELEAARGGRDAALAKLRRWAPDAAVDAMTDPDFDRLPVTREQLLFRLDELGPIRGDAAFVETAAAEVAVARSDKRPDWSLTAAYGQRDRDRSDMLSVEVAVALPWFANRRNDAAVLARESEYRQAVALRDDRRREMAAEIDAAFAHWETLKRQVALHETRLLPLARDRSAAALAAYRAGGDLQPWLDVRAAEFEVHRSHAEHLGELGHAWAQLAFLLPEHTP